MSSATELAYGLPKYEPVPALIINKLARALKQIAECAEADQIDAGPREAQSLRSIQLMAEYVLEEYCEPHGYGEPFNDPSTITRDVKDEA